MKILAAIAGLAFLAACQPYPPPPPPPPQHFVAPIPPPAMPPPPAIYPEPYDPPRTVKRHYRRYERRADRRCPIGYTWVRAHQRTVGVYGQGEVHRSTRTIPGRCIRRN